ncbi:phosphatase PAP2 family protein [Actinocrinis puniceicyclus]|uniref:Phosphatase PAP2 family protein n=1 Tax=Actinocrinis puniceicyclus TaxID=977794 RepID=A0A8J7WLR3_9ACTN|nr:phosphatase PAP2 family protein [Actinocrinis puniceicyclus]MBS2963170.1 phosphatase PAP2 family protein [Actinocrinis puniceicyclus]
MTTRRPPAGTPAGLRALGTRLSLVVLVSVPAFLIVALIAVAVEGSWAPLRRVDGSASQHMHLLALNHPLWVRTMLIVSDVGSPTVMRALVVVLAVVLWLRRAHRLALWAAVTLAGGALIDVVLKAAVGRARPHFVHPVALAPGGSFPSGHAFTSALAAGVVLLWALPLLSRRGKVAAWVLAVLVPLLVGVSRVALGVHWVTDVVGGWLLGAGLVAATSAAFETWRQRSGLRRTRPATEGVAPEETQKAANPGETA